MVNTIEALDRQIRKTIETKGHFPDEEAARKLIYLSITNAQKSWKQTHPCSSALLSARRLRSGRRRARLGVTRCPRAPDTSSSIPRPSAGGWAVTVHR